MWMSCGVTYLVRGWLPVSSTSGYPDASAYDSTAIECRIPIRLSALKDRLIAARLRSLYLSSHSLEMAWMDKAEKQKQLLRSFSLKLYIYSIRLYDFHYYGIDGFMTEVLFLGYKETFMFEVNILWSLLHRTTSASFHSRPSPNNSNMSIRLPKTAAESAK